jgi:glycyl-tRNA synthetase
MESSNVPAMSDVVTMEKIVSLARRRGFVFPSSEIYGGLGSAYDYGHYGVLMKENVKARWLEAMVREREDIVALDSSIILHPRVWEASGHVTGFTDPLVDCRTCKLRFRADHLEDLEHEEVHCGRKPSKRPGETSECDLTKPRQFNLMFKTRIGAVEETGLDAYLRPETAQGIFVNFKNVAQIARRKPPFGIAQIGKAFRNEITPGNFIFRTLEFEQMEMEYFVPPPEAERWYRYWIEERLAWYVRLGIRESHLRVRAHEAEELSHYSSATSDIEYLFPIGWSELEGIANRGDYDLKAHTEASGTKLEWVDSESGERYTPYVVEPAAGVNRSLLAFLVDAYDEEVVAERPRTVLRLHPELAPVKVAVLPLIPRNEEISGRARALYEELRRAVVAEYDDSGQIGRRYRRQDEIGTPYALTIDEQTLEDDTVTIRDRDTLEQERIAISGARAVVQDKLAQDWKTPKAS